MWRITLTLGFALWAGAALATTKVALVGFTADFGAAVQKEMGSAYQVKAFKVDHQEMNLAREVNTFGPQTVLVAAPQIDLSEGAQLDGFEPSMRVELSGFKTSDQTAVYLLLPTGAGLSANFETYGRPLAVQAAREANVTVIEHEGDINGREAEDFVAETLAPQTIKAHWRLIRASSEQKDEGPAANAIDGDPDTYWHTEYDPVQAKPPHELVIDLGEAEWMVGLRYLPRQDGGMNGSAKGYEVYVGDTPDSQTTLVSKGEFKNGRGYKTARFKESVKARYIRFVILSEQSGGPYGSAAELDVIRDPHKN